LPDGLLAWYNSPATGNDWDPSNPVNGTQIISWHDTSQFVIQHNLNAPSGSEPEYTTNTQNGLPSIFYNGTQDKMSAISFTQLALLTGATMFIICKFLDNSTQQTVTITNFNDFKFSISGSTAQYVIGMANGVGTDTISSVDKNFNLHTILFDSSLFGNSSRLKYYRNQILQTLNFGVTNVGSSTNASNNTLYVAQTQSATELFNGYIGEILIYSRILPNDEQQTVENYLRQKWGL